MPVQITIPSPGESITDVVVGPWHKASGEWVQKDEIIVEIESDKVTLEIPAPESGLLHRVAEDGAEMTVGDVIGSIEPAAQRPTADTVQPATAAQSNAAPAPSAPTGDGESKATSVARKLAADRGVDLAHLAGTGSSGRITKSDVLAAAAPQVGPDESQRSRDEDGPDLPRSLSPTPAAAPGDRAVRRQRMSKLRRRVAERLVAAQHTAAMLTTFNEADMSGVIRLRKQHKEEFLQKHGVGLGFMSFFVKACVSALRQFPRVNAYIVGNEIEYHDYVDISIAVGTEKGLVVPVIRNAEAMSFADIETTILDLATRARESKLALEEMTGGTFTISNGGVYGSMLSTPILNPPQSGILGMHNITNRPVEDPGTPGQIVLRPMMYLALSYDHRIVDGAEAVGFLVNVKNCIENPQRMLLGL
ncbi:MAG: 2-oxoglutarate dehydrogenase complex dihydrolipoyllysine-residue succinyltransferase [Planctomycetota bacterium]|nr:2-oxoglutarate dehydrogenase complex dihydrolipoyllysine-residue succinyltransferase [Planctomycetota bacterium]